jgi:hypothetical protein
LVTPEVRVKSFSTHQTINLLATGRFVSALSGGQLYFNGARFSLKALPVEIATRPWIMSIVTLKDRTLVRSCRPSCDVFARSPNR